MVEEDTGQFEAPRGEVSHRSCVDEACIEILAHAGEVGLAQSLNEDGLFKVLNAI